MRSVLVAAAVFGLVLGSGAAAGAAETARSAGPGWTCAKDVCLRVGDEARLKDAHGCNHKVCVTVSGNASGYTTRGIYGGSSRFYGHINVWGPGMRVEGRDSAYPGATGSGRGSGQTCAEGWELSGGTYTSVGLPCEEVS
ncbi:hypothetical protein ACIQVT_02540 [Streptomyces sp. NPDC100445]|uniref:hypothetical protein n=1 Tax=Streptomyces sp. NPDC100445 TaxID=3366102 RepID=UPI0038080706